MWISLIQVVVATFLAPILLFAPLWRRSRNRWESVFALGAAATFTVLLFQIGRWDIVGFPLRYVLVGAFALSALRWWRLNRGGAPPGRRATVRAAAGLAVMLLFVAMAVTAAMGRRLPAGAIELRFPLAEGDAYVAQGGASTLVNYHHAFLTQQFALDIVQLGTWGRRASGWFPSELAAYAIFGQTVVSPCAGDVIAAVDGLPDRAIGESDPDNPAGNHVVLRCQGVRVELAHLRRTSVAVRTGDHVEVAVALGEVGNSGNTSEPHLHIHAQADGDDGAGVPVTFGGRFLTRNDIWRGVSSGP